MAIAEDTYRQLQQQLTARQALLVAVSKTKPVEDLKALYQLGQRDFGENYVQELCDKQPQLPGDIRWHFIGHLQRNKVKYIAPFVYMIHGVDSYELLQEINKQAAKYHRIIHCLLQLHVAKEATKFGLDAAALAGLLETITIQKEQLANVRICGVMGMASFTENRQQVRAEFDALATCYQQVRTALPFYEVNTLSMGMSGDYALALEAGSNLVRIGSLLFGSR